MLEEFDREMEHTDSRMRSLTARVNKAIKKSGSKLYHDGDIAPLFVMLVIYFFPFSSSLAGKCQLITILILVIILIVVVIFFFIPF